MTEFPTFLAASAALSLAVVATATGQTVFEDDFNADSSANWTVLDASLNGISDATVLFAHDYSQDVYTITSDGQETALTVPPNPYDDSGTTLGLKLAVNSDDDGAEAAVSLFPNGVNMSGNYALRFEMFQSYNGPAYGGSGSTEFSVFGLNQSGAAPTFLDGNDALEGDGLFFAVSGEGGASRDYRGYSGDGLTPPLFLDENVQEFGFVDLDMDLFGEFNVEPGSPLERVFPSPKFETPGAPGKAWVRVEVRQVDGVVTWAMNGHIFAQIQPENLFKDSGNVVLGYSDPFSSIADPGEENYVIFDNVRVVDLTGAPALPIISATSPGQLVLDPQTFIESFVPDPISEDGGSATFTISRDGPTDSALEVNFNMIGSATPDVDYVAPTPLSVTIPAGATSATVTVEAINDEAEEPTEEIVLAIADNPAFETLTEPFAVTPLEDDGDIDAPEPEVDPIPEDAELVFSEEFASDVSAQWTVNADTDDAEAIFAYDYSADGVPPAPNTEDGSTRGLKFTANMSLGAAASIAVSPTGESFDGDVILALDVWMNYNGPLPGGGGGSTEFISAGVGTTGDHPQTGDDASDGAWFMASGDGGVSTDFRLFLDGVVLAAADFPGVYAAGSQNNSAAFYQEAFPEGAVPPQAQIDAHPQQTGATSGGQTAFRWHRMFLSRIGDEVTWTIGNEEIARASQSDSPFSDSGNIFIGYSDIFSSVSDNAALSFGLIDNVRVYALEEETALTPSVALAFGENGALEVEFVGVLESAPTVAGPWMEVAASGAAPMKIVVSADNVAEFFRAVVR